MSGFARAVATVASIAAIIPGPHQPIAAAVATVASIGAQLTAKKPRNDRQGTSLSFKIDPGAPLSYVMGRAAIGGTIVHKETYGTDQSYFTYFVDLGAGGPYDAIEAFLADRAPVGFSGTSALGYYANWMWQDQQLGQTPEPRALTNGIGRAPYGTAGQVPGWSDAHRMSGHAAASLSMLYDTKARRYANGEPLPGWIIRGAKVYDPRRDSTYPGGSGSCRWVDPSDTAAHAAARATWVYSTSPALHGLMWRLGIWQRDETNPTASYQRIMGIGAPIDLIDVAAIVNAANVQEANGWTIGGEVTSAQDKWEVLKLIDQSGGSEPISVGARMSTLVKAPRVPLRVITQADLADGTLSSPAMRARSERINGYRARFRSEPHGWEMTSIDIVQVPLYVTEDGRQKTGAGDFSLVTDPDQCAELAAYEVFDSREIEPISIPLKPFAVAYRLGDCLTLDLPELALEMREAVVRGRSVDPVSGIVTLTFRSETAAKHPACLGQTGDTPPSPTLTAPPDSIAAPGAEAWVIAAGTGTDAGLTVPALVVAGAVDNSNADGIIVEWRRVGETEWQSAGLLPPDTQAQTIAPVDASTAYEVAIRYRGRGIYSIARVYGPVTTGAASADWSTGVTGPGKPADNATNSADPASPFGLDGTIGEAAALLAKIDPIEVRSDLLGKAVIDLAAVERQARRDLARLAERQLGDIVEAGRTRAIIRDAGVQVDPATGKVRIYALDQAVARTAAVEVGLDAVRGQLTLRATIEQVEEIVALAAIDPSQIAELGAIIGRINTVEIDLNAAEAAISLKADATTVTALGGSVKTISELYDALNGVVVTKVSRSDFNAQGDRLNSIEQVLSTLPDGATSSLTLRAARRVAEGAAVDGLAAVVGNSEERRLRVVAAAEARTETYARIVDGERATAGRLDTFAATFGAADARAATQLEVLAAADQASARSQEALGAELGRVGATVIRQGEALATETEARGQAVSQVRAEFDPRITAAKGTADAAGLAAGAADRRITTEVARIDRAVAGEMEARGEAVSQVRAEFDPRITAAKTAADTAAGAAGAADRRITTEVARLDLAVSNETEARGQAVTRVRADFGKQVDQVNADRNAGDLAVLREIATQVSAEASRSDQAIARAAEAQAISTQAVNARVDGNSASIVRIDKVVATPTGATAVSINALDSNGRIIGTKASNDGKLGRYQVASDIFEVVDPVTGAVLFYVDSQGAVVGRLRAKSIETEQLANGASGRQTVWITTEDVVIPYS